jgi:hypothetical protein
MRRYQLTHTRPSYNYLFAVYQENPTTLLPPPPEARSSTREQPAGNGIDIVRFNHEHDIEELLISYGARRIGRGLYLCPFHDDKRASLGVYVRSGVSGKVLQGLYPQGNIAYGFDLQGKKNATNVVVRDEMYHVVDIFNWYYDYDLGSTTIANKLNDERFEAKQALIELLDLRATLRIDDKGERWVDIHWLHKVHSEKLFPQKTKRDAAEPGPESEGGRGALFRAFRCSHPVGGAASRRMWPRRWLSWLPTRPARSPLSWVWMPSYSPRLLNSQSRSYMVRMATSKSKLTASNCSNYTNISGLFA